MTNPVNQIYLAPMEGVIDSKVRDLLTKVNDYDYCLTEFIRVVDRKVPHKLFYKIAPELRHSCHTPSGTPVRLQLLGQDPNWMAENAIIGSELGSHGIDLNFGCPAPTVNKRKGGASLLKCPQTLFNIISAVKNAITPLNQEVSVKIRLGFDDTSLFNEIVDAVKAAAPSTLTVHARTKKQGYRPPAHWHHLSQIETDDSLMLIANGEIWNQHDANECIRASNISNIMLGRGALALPNLANVIKYNEAPMTWQQTCKLLQEYNLLLSENINPFYYSSRIKQWMRYLKLEYSEANEFFQRTKRVEESAEMYKELTKEIESVID